MRFEGLIFDFDGVLIESEYVGNRMIAEYLTSIGHPTTTEHAVTHFAGLAGRQFTDALEAWIGRTLPDDYLPRRRVEDERILREGVEAVAGAIVFVESLPADLPRAIASSSSTVWIETHLRHIGLLDDFAGHIFSGKEHVTRGKPAPDIYLHAAAAIGVPIEKCAIIEDSVVGATGAVASGAYVIGLAAGMHCLDGHDARLTALGVNAVAHDFDEVARLLA